MSTSPGQRAKEAANAAKARGIYRDLQAITQGAGIDFCPNTGKHLKMGVVRRDNRVDKASFKQEVSAAGDEREFKEHLVQNNSHDRDKDRDGYTDVFEERYRVERIEVVGISADDYDDARAEEIVAILEFLRDQIPDLFDIHDQSLFQELCTLSVPEEHVDLLQEMFSRKLPEYKLVKHQT